MTDQNKIGWDCRWQRLLPHLTALDSGDPQRSEWEAHATGCLICKRYLAGERELIPRLASMPDRGGAFVAGAVMRRIRNSRARFLGRRELTWGLAGSVAGAVLGLWLASASPQRTTVQTTASSTSGYAEVSDEVDLLIASFAGDQSGGGS